MSRNRSSDTRMEECTNCKILKKEVKKLSKKLEEEKQKRKTQKAQDQSTLHKFERMYLSLRKTHDELIEEFKTYSRELSNYEGREEHMAKHASEISALKSALTRSQSHTQQLEEEFQNELVAKNQALAKAQSLIKRLNDECEKLSEQCENLQERLEQAPKFTQPHTKKCFDCKDKDDKIRFLTTQVEELEYEKDNLEGTLDNMEHRFQEIEEISKSRVEMYSESCSKVQELEEALAYKESVIQELSVVVSNKQNEEELEFLKDQLRNLLKVKQPEERQPLRELHSNVKRTDPCKPKKREEASKQDLKLQLAVSIAREHKMKKVIEEYFNRESAALVKAKEFYDDCNLGISAELERWIMRNEELEGKLEQAGETNFRLTLLVRDFHKALQVKNKHMHEQKIAYERTQSQLQSHIHHLANEIENYKAVITDDLVPHSENTLTSSLSKAHACVHHLKNELNSVRTELKDKEMKIEQLEHTNFQVRSENFDFKDALVALRCIERIVTHQELEEETASPQYNHILEAVRQLDSYKAKCEYDLGVSDMHLRILKQKEADWADKQERFLAQIKNIREIAAQDNEDRARIQESLELELKDCQVKVERLTDENEHLRREHKFYYEKYKGTKDLKNENQQLKELLDDSFMSEDERLTAPNMVKQLEAARKKHNTVKRSFERRVYEFELILRCIEDKLSLATNPQSSARSERMYEFVNGLKEQNPSLHAWLSSTIDTIEMLTSRYYREISCYKDICAIGSSSLKAPVFNDIIDMLNDQHSSIDQVVRNLLEALAGVVLNKSDARQIQLCMEHIRIINKKIEVVSPATDETVAYTLEAVGQFLRKVNDDLAAVVPPVEFHSLPEEIPFVNHLQNLIS